MHDIAEFLGEHEPFTELDPDALDRIASRTEVEYFAAGTTIIAQAAPPQARIRVIRRGAVELLDRGRVVDLLAEGEMFGHPSVLSGLPTRYEVRAHDDTLCYSLAAEDVIPLLGRQSSLRFLTRSLLKRTRAMTPDEAEALSAAVARQPAGALVPRPPVFTDPQTSLRDAARLMEAEGVSSVLIRLSDGDLGIVTDRDFRSQVVAGRLSPDEPVSEAMSAPVIGVGADQTGADAMITMIEHDIRHVAVFSPDSELLGVIVAIDLVTAEAQSPFVVRRAIATARNKSELREAAARLRSTLVALHHGELGPAQISEVISVVADALIRRMIELALESEGPPPAEFCWISLGSHGRREPVPSSDIDSGMAWKDRPDPDPLPSEARRRLATSQIARYMRSIAQDVADTVRVIGWRLDPHGVTATGAFSASSIEDWRRSIVTWLANPTDNRVLIATSILLDGRTVYGPERELDVKGLLYETGDRSTLLRWMLRLALASKPPTGFRHDIVVEDSGEHRGTFDIKQGGLLPIVDLARYAALKAEVRASGTLERLRAATDAGVLEPAHSRVLVEAFHLFSALRLEHQIARLEAGAEPDDHLDPKELNSLTRHYLRDAFREVAAIQRSISGELVAP